MKLGITTKSDFSQMDDFIGRLKKLKSKKVDVPRGTKTDGDEILRGALGKNARKSVNKQVSEALK